MRSYNLLLDDETEGKIGKIGGGKEWQINGRGSWEPRITNEKKKPSTPKSSYTQLWSRG